MRVITLNVNGIRSAASKGFFKWLTRQTADVVCLQETRARTEQLTERVYWPASFHCHYHAASQAGYSGVAILSRRAPDRLVEGIGWEWLDGEGRYLEARFGRLSVISLYLPSGTSGDERQAVKYRFMDRFLPMLKEFAKSDRDYVIAGDWNIAHRAIDLKNWRSNQKNSGFLPEERAWMDKVFGCVRLVDAFRVVNQGPDQYTWWSNRGRAWQNNVGWRIDYQVVNVRLSERVVDATIYKRKRFSDHAPLIIDYEYDL
jgi:exodeoxyribonuclease-3